MRFNTLLFVQFVSNSQSLSNFIYNCRYPFPFVLKARICFSCYRVGKVCRSQSRCVYCGDSKHSPDDCAQNTTPPKCIICGGDHLATSHECSLVVNHKMTLAAVENISFIEAKRSVDSSSPPFFSSSSFSTDPRYDFHNFSLLPHTHSSQYSVPPFSSPNKFAILSNLSRSHDFQGSKSYSSVARNINPKLYFPSFSHINFPSSPKCFASSGGS